LIFFQLSRISTKWHSQDLEEAHAAAQGAEDHHLVEEEVEVVEEEVQVVEVDLQARGGEEEYEVEEEENRFLTVQDLLRKKRTCTFESVI